MIDLIIFAALGGAIGLLIGVRISKTDIEKITL